MPALTVQASMALHIKQALSPLYPQHPVRIQLSKTENKQNCLKPAHLCYLFTKSEQKTEVYTV